MPQFILHGDSQAQACIAFIRQRHQTQAQSGKPLIVSITEENKRSAAQNRMMHSMFGDLAKQARHCNQKLSIDVWKRLCTAAYLREINEKPQMIPALDGNGFDIIYERTSSLGAKKASGLIEWVGAFGAECNVEWTKFGKVPEEQW